MRNVRSSARLAAVAAAGALVLAACGGGGDDNGGASTSSASGFNLSTTTIVNPSDKTGGTLKLGAGSDCDSWDPARAYYGWCWNMQRLYARDLMGFASNPKEASKVVPDLATAPGKPNADFTEFTYTLRDGLKYDDGTPVTSADIKYALERAFATDVINGGPTQYFLPLLDDGANKTGTPTYQGPYKDKTGQPMVNGKPSMQTPDDKTIIFHLTQPYSSFDYLMAMGPSSPIPKAKDDGENYTEHPVSTGPFKITDYNKDTGITFERNPNWDHATDQIRTPKVDEITIDYISNLDDIDQRMKAGTLDARADNRLQPTFQNEALADPNLKKQVDDPVDGSLRYLAISPDVPPLDNIHCRLAVFYAINKEAWRLAFGGAVGGLIAGSLTPAGLPGHDDKANKYANGADSKGDLNKAKQELAACGQPNGFSTNMAFQNQGTGAARATTVQEALGRVGIRVTPKAGETATYYTNFIGSPASVKNNKLGLMDAAWGADYPTTNGFWYSLAHSKANNPSSDSNYVNLSDPKVDQLLDQALVAKSNQWDQIGRQLDDAIMNDAVYLPIMWTKSAYWRNERLTNVYSTNFFGLYDWVNMGVNDGV
jgi:peptide/nickel transport system substrate-binding protein